LGSDPSFVLTNLFLPNDVQLDWIERLWARFTTFGHDNNAFNMYIEACDKHDTPVMSSILKGSEEEGFVLKLLAENRSCKLRILTDKFRERFYGDFAEFIPSIKDVREVLAANGFTRKRVTWFSVHRDPVEQLAYLDHMMSIMAKDIVDVDGMVQSNDDFFARYGWALHNERCERFQISIAGDIYAVMAAYTIKGFIYWEVFGITVTSKEVVGFLTNLREHTLPDSFLILDNAPNQTTAEVVSVLSTLYEGMYKYCAKYSPELKPVERGLSNVKDFIRERDSLSEWRDKPWELIEAAFVHYSDEGLGSSAANNHFQLYYDNNDYYKKVNGS
jgi:transposase